MIAWYLNRIGLIHLSNLGIRSNERSDCAMQREQAAVAQLVEQRIRNA